MAKWLMAVPPLAFAALAGMFWLGMQRENPNDLPSTFIGREVPKVDVAALGDLPQLTDAVLKAPGVKVVNFWASWCAPCRAEHPQLEALAAEGVTIHGVNYKDEPEKALAFLAELGNPYASIGADPGRMGLDWGLYGVPETFIVDAEGRVRFRYPGPITQQELDRVIRPELAKAAQ